MNKSAKQHSVFTGKVVIITGATAGIGWATAVSFAQAGATIVATGRRQPRLDALLTTFPPGPHLAIAGDIHEPDFPAELVAQTLNKLGRIDILINNAGVGQHHPLADIPREAAETVFRTNVLGLLQMAQAVIPPMRQQGGGHIVNVSSIVGQRPLPQGVVYAASKTAVNFLSRGLRFELQPDNIHLTTVYPGLTATEFADVRLGRQGGNRFGLHGIPAERVGKAIVRAVANGRSECYITPFDWLFAHLNRLFPRTLDALLAQMAYWDKTTK